MSGIVSAMRAFDDVPYCIQWTVTRRLSKGASSLVMSSHDDGVFDDISTLVKACVLMARERTRDRLGLSKAALPLPDLHFYQPTLILDAPLFLYNVRARSLTKTNWLVVKVAIDTIAGTTRRIVDVLHRDALADLVKRYRAVGDALRTNLESSASGLRMYAFAQHEAFNATQKRRRAYVRRSRE
jgi:hypothetical protein